MDYVDETNYLSCEKLTDEEVKCINFICSLIVNFLKCK